MEWLSCIKGAINYIEEHLLTIESQEEISKSVNVSTMYLQRGFYVITGYSIGEYIRNRRLYLAALRLVESDDKIIDIAFEHGYETPESFTKAFTRFHKATPSEIRANRALINAFQPLRVSITIQGGNSMRYTVDKMSRLKMIGYVREFSFETSQQEIPKFWDEMYTEHMARVCEGNEPSNEEEWAIYDNRVGEFGICMDDIGKEGKFRYMIGGRFHGGNVPEGMEVYEIPAATWARFKCVGPMPTSLQTVNNQIWNEWLPGNQEYELDGNYNLEWYSPSGTMQDTDYQSEIWIPVRKVEK